MKIVTFWAIQLVLIFLYIYKASVYVNAVYAKQRDERKRSELLEQKSTLFHKLQQIKNKETIKKEAEKQGMRPINLSQIKKLADFIDGQTQ